MKTFGKVAALAAGLCLLLTCLFARTWGQNPLPTVPDKGTASARAAKAAPAVRDVPPASSLAAKPAPAGAPVAAEPEAKRVYEVDFRGKTFDRARLAPLGHGSLYGLTLIRPEEEGLRITIPDHQGEDKPYVGVAPAFEIHGDFEITATYEMLATEIPKPVTGRAPFTGAGAGPNLYILARKTLDSATLRRCVTPNGSQVYLVNWMVRDEKGRRPWRGKSFAASATTGKLRLARTGDRLRFLVAEGDSKEFIELYQAQFGTEPIGLVRVEAMTDGSPTTVIMRWKDLKIQGEKLEPMKIPVLTGQSGS